MKYLSLFSGVEAASVAWHELGWECVAVSEIEPFACAVLAHRFPKVPNLGDVTKVTEADIAALGRIDLVVFGSPCQDLSVAGKRKGLAGERSGLFHVAMRIIGWVRKHCGCRWALWENVPGAFSSNAGRDFAAVVEQMAGVAVDVPRSGWGTEGVALGEEGLVEWAVLDAQWFGVAQRRRRVFALADFGDWANRPPVLLESYRLRGDSAPSREAGQGAAGGAGASAAGFRMAAFGEYEGDDTASTMKARDYKDATDLAVQPVCVTGDVTHTLKAEGFDASEDGTGRGQPIIAVGTDCYNGSITGDVACTMGTPGSSVNASGPTVMVCHGTQDPIIGHDQAHTLGRNSGQENAVLAYPLLEVGKRTGASTTDLRAGMGIGNDNDPMFTLQAGAQHGVATKMAVRRLTPTECERLQGFPDGHTLVPHRGKPAADGPRYKALGNSMAVPVMRWIGEQIAIAELC